MRKVIIASPVATQSGYGHHAREIITNLIEKRGNEWDIKLVSLPWGHTPFTYPLTADLQNRIIPLPLREQPDLWIQVTVPNEFQAIGKVNIGVTAGTEGDICPAEWIDKINQMQITIVPTQFTKTVFENTAKQSGKPITTKIQVIPEYFDETVYTDSAETLTILNDITEKTCFLTVGHWLQGQFGEDRKNISGVVYSFFNTFKNKKDAPGLILKTSGATYSIVDQMDIESKVNQIKTLFSKTDRLPNVYILHGDLTDAEMNMLYNHPKVHAMFSLTKAEGFGRPLLEFTATAKPIIAPYHSGQCDFLKRDFICEVPGGLTEIHPSAQNEFLIAGAKWFTPDYTLVGKQLEDVLKNSKKWKELAKRQRYFSKTLFTKTAVSGIYDDVLRITDEYLAKLPKAIELKLPKLKPVQLPKLESVGK